MIKRCAMQAGWTNWHARDVAYRLCESSAHSLAVNSDN